MDNNIEIQYIYGIFINYTKYLKNRSLMDDENQINHNKLKAYNDYQWHNRDFNSNICFLPVSHDISNIIKHERNLDNNIDIVIVG